MGAVSDDLVCPSCGEDDNLRGRPIDSHDPSEGIRVTCGQCRVQWDRRNEARCPRCAGNNMYLAPVAIIEKSRGSQLSILGTRTTPLCWECDRDLIDAQRQSGTALMPDELPTMERGDT